MNSWNGIGRLTRDAELRYIPGSGQAVANFTLAVDKKLSKENKQKMEAQNKPTADFINCVAWGQLAENLCKFTEKGLLVGVNGAITTGSYEAKDGSKRYTTDINVASMEFLEWKNNNSAGANNSIGEDFYPIDNDDIPF